MTDAKPAADRPRTREQRLAEALRANLRRRKAARRQDEAAPGQAPEPAGSPDESGPSDRRS